MTTYLYPTIEYQHFFQATLSPFLGAESSSNDYTDLILALFEYVLNGDVDYQRLVFIDTLLAYGLVEQDAERILSEGLSLVAYALSATLQNAERTEYELELLDSRTLVVRDRKKKTTPSLDTQQMLHRLEQRMQEELNNGSWFPERERKVYETLFHKPFYAR